METRQYDAESCLIYTVWLSLFLPKLPTLWFSSDKHTPDNNSAIFVQNEVCFNGSTAKLPMAWRFAHFRTIQRWESAVCARRSYFYRNIAIQKSKLTSLFQNRIVVHRYEVSKNASKWCGYPYRTDVISFCRSISVESKGKKFVVWFSIWKDHLIRIWYLQTHHQTAVEIAALNQFEHFVHSMA